MTQRPNSSSVPTQHLNPSLIGGSPPPPISPQSQIPATLQFKHSRSISQPEERNVTTGFNPSLPPSPFSMYHSTVAAGGNGENLPPRNSHRRSNSFGMMLPQTLNSPSIPSFERSISGGQVSDLVPRQSEMEVLLRAYTNLIDTTTDSEEVSSGMKRRPAGAGDPSNRHHRTVSMDEKLLMNSNAASYNIKFSADEWRRISADAKLADIVRVNPKRAKRILANRLSAARSKDKKTEYAAGLQLKVLFLQNEATSLSARLTHLQRNSMGLQNENSELKFRLQAMEQQAQLRDALSEKLTEEVQRLKLVTGELPSHIESKTSPNLEMFQQQLRISQLQQQQHSNQNSTMNANYASND